MSVNYGRPGSKAARTREVTHRLLLDQANGPGPNDLRTNLRFVFYELEQQGEARKPSPDDRRPNRRRSIGWPPGSQDITDGVTWLREEGIVHWRWITDETRTLTEWAYAQTVAEYMLDTLPHARLNAWGGELPPVILCESAATAAVLRYEVAQDYVAPISGIRGHSAGFLRNEIAPLFAHGGRRVFYLGDLDRSGMDIEANARRVLEREHVVDWQRLAMTEDQAADIDPIWKTDGRTGKGEWAWEVESLGQVRLAQLLRGTLDELLPEPLARVREREQAQQAPIRAALEALS
jgi:hypothetical protein